MKKKIVLMVEDDGVIAVILHEMLVGLGYSVTGPVATGEAAIAAAAADVPDLVLMDIQLAGEMDGITAAGHIRSVADIPIVFLTGYSQDPLLQRAKIAAPYGYVLKPVSQRELAITIEMALYKHAFDHQIKEHQDALQQAHDELERRVQERTADLLSANESLRKEMAERRLAEKQVSESKASLTMAIDGISDPLIMLDAKLRVIRLNKAAKDYFGLAGFQETIGKLCFEAFYGRSHPCEGCERSFSDIHGYSGAYERKGRMDPGRIEQVVVDVVWDKSGAPEATIVRIVDITQARLMDRQLIQHEKLASLGLLLAGIAHEINNPNNFIFFNIPILRSYLQFLLPIVDEYVSVHPELQAFGRPYSVFREDCFKLLDNMAHGSTRINQIVGNLREFVRERGKGEMRRIDLKQVVEKGISICLGRIRKTVKTFEVNIPEGLPDLVTDPLAIEQVVVNILINAAQAMDKEDSWVRLTITGPIEPDGEVIVEVSDNGCGMDADTQKKIFDPFFTTKAVGVGTGLGMSISHRLVTELGGCIDVRSQTGQGSVFQVRLKTTPS